MPFTASSVLGIGAGLATIKAAKDKLDKLISNMQPVYGSKPIQVKVPDLKLMQKGEFDRENNTERK